jgi:hypothetical protein
MHRTLPLSVRCGAVRQTALTGRRNSIPVASGEVRPVLTRRHLKHRTLKPASGAHRPVRCQNANLSAHESGGHRTRPVQHKERPVTPRRADITRAQGFLAAGSFPLRSLAAPASSPCPSAAAAVDSRPSAAPLESSLAPDPLRESPPFPLLASALLSSKS